MQKMLKKISSLLIALILCFGINVAVNGVTSNTIVADAATDYYAPITATKGTSLLGQVHDLITKTHSYYSSYADCKDPSIIKKTDPGSSSSYVMEFYSQANILATWGSGANGTWNREHVWCQSLSKEPSGHQMWGENGGGSDLHHLRPAETRLNSTRGNDKYGLVSNRENNKAYYKDAGGNNVAHGGYSGGGIFEPLDKVKGDVARIVMYVYTHYNTYSNLNGSTNGSGNSGYFGTLKFTNIISKSSESAAIDLLLDWHESDPVDDIERTRNEAVYQIQGNRNPFIDHPEYADYIWGDGSSTPGGDTTLTGLTLSPSTLNLTVGQAGSLTVSATPSNASKAVNWTTSDASVATVSGGTVTAKSEGTATITATSTTNSSIKATATVKVTKATSSTPTESTITIDISKFSSLSSSYGFQKWSSGGINGIAYIYGGAKDKMQFNSDRTKYLASTTASLNPITSVTVKLNSGSKPQWKLLTSTSAYGETSSNPSSGNDWGTKSVTTSGTTWTVSGNDTCFALVYEGTGACYLDSVTVTFAESTTPEVPPVEEHVCKHVCDTCHKCTDKSCTDTVCKDKCEGHGSVQPPVEEHVCEHVCDTCHKCTDKSCADPVCKDKCEGHGGGQQPEGGNVKLQAFHKAVEGIVSEGSLAQRLESINQAIIAYSALSADDKALATEDIEALKAAINLYNQAVGAYNDEFASANHAVNGGAN